MLVGGTCTARLFPVLLLLALLSLTFDLGPTPTEAYLSRRQPCNISAHNTTSFKELALNSNSICDPTNRLTCIKGKSATADGVCDCDPLLAKQKAGTDFCLGLYGAPCKGWKDWSSETEIFYKNCHDDLQCVDVKDSLTKLTDREDNLENQQVMFGKDNDTMKVCICKDGRKQLADLTCSHGISWLKLSRGLGQVWGLVVVSIILGQFL